MNTVNCTFHPQAWINDYAIPVDPIGPVEWVASPEYLKTLSDGWTEPNTCESDSLRDDPNAPEWVREWDGPFYVSVTLTVDSRIIDIVTGAYLECVQFTDINCDSDIPEDAEFSPEAEKQAREECADFLAYCGDDAREYAERLSWERFGHDFWFNRNSHGVGFWDRGIGELGKRLSDAADTFGGRDVYQGDDGLVYFA